ncbi:hypothetical protein JW916_16330 [Candidatus Sumerlaeota bacterium]|nr:hypothetical protein [Candidatus Sumerlaeota bacterium]
MSRRRVASACLLGLLGSLFIWIATPYHNFVINGSFISDSFLPIAALFVMFVFVLGLNPLLRVLVPRFALSQRQLALVLGIMLIASVIPGQGLLRQLPYTLASAAYTVNNDRILGEIYDEMNLRPSLFPDAVGYGKGTWISDRFVTELLPGESIPWAAWVPPLLSWGVFLIASWLMMVGLSLIVLPQWRRNERLAFPLLTVQQSLIEDPGEGHAFSPIFRRRSFWIAAVTVIVLQTLSGLQVYFPEGVPAVPLDWNLGFLFTEPPLSYIPGHIHSNRLYFIFLAVAFFMPSRIGFSVWFFALAYGAYEAIGKAYFPPYHGGTVTDHRTGATVAVMLGILWLGRSHWAHVFRCVFGRVDSDEDRRDRMAGIMFLVGCAGMFLWLVWAGVQPGWALSFVAFAFGIALVTTRVVAETGIPFIRLDTGYKFPFIHMANPASVTFATLYFSYFMTIIFTIPSRVCTTTMAAHSIGLDEKAPPRYQSRVAWLLIAVLVVGVLISGPVHLWCSYHYSAPFDQRRNVISFFGIERLIVPHKVLHKLKTTHILDTPQVYSQPAHMAFGAALAGLLQWGCLASPRFMLHPIGLLMVGTFYGTGAWGSIFMGWLLKVLILHYGGARLYRRAIPLFLGLILGEVLATVGWCAVPSVLVLLGKPYLPFDIQPQ